MSYSKRPHVLALAAASLLAGCIINTDSDDSDTDPSGADASTSGDPGTGSSGGDGSSGEDASSGEGSSTGADGSTGSGPGPMSGCMPYQPSQAGDTYTGTWMEAGDEQSFSFTAPEDAGGGIVRVELAASVGDTIPSLVVRGGGDTSGAIISGSAAGTEDTSTKFAAFAVHPGISYELTAIANSGAGDFTLTWAFEGLVDCWEPNDTPEEATQALVGEPIEAFAHTGYQTNYVYATEFVDWYRVTLDEPGGLRATLAEPPADHRMRLRLYADPTAPHIASAGGTAPDQVLSFEAADLEAGDYFVVVEVADAGSQVVTDQDADPQSWSTPYVVDLETF